MKKLNIERRKSGKEYDVLINSDKIGTANFIDDEVQIESKGYEIIKNYRFKDISNKIQAFYFFVKDDSIYKGFDIIPFSDMDYLSFIKEQNETQIYLSFNIDFLNWHLSLSPNNFTSNFIKLITQIDNIHCSKEVLNDEFGLYTLELTSSIKKEISIEANVYNLLNIIERTIKVIYNKEFSVNTFFSFPKEYKTACEQYLLYFATFLKDLGIEAKTGLENQENGVLFKVFPKDKDAALTQIKEALDVYLALPVEQNIDQAATQFPDAAVQQLISNVYHLKSQLVLANSTIIKLQDKNEKLELFQYENKQIIHLDEVNKNQKNEEQLFGGIITVKEYDGKGFNIDLPRLFRMMKRVWKK